MYLRSLQRSESLLAHLRYHIRQVQRRYNLQNIVPNLAPEIILASRLKHVQAVAGVSSGAHNRLARFQAVAFSYALAIAVGAAPVVVVINVLFVCCPTLWWNYLRS